MWGPGTYCRKAERSDPSPQKSDPALQLFPVIEMHNHEDLTDTHTKQRGHLIYPNPSLTLLFHSRSKKTPVESAQSARNPIFEY